MEAALVETELVTKKIKAGKLAVSESKDKQV